MVVRTDWYAGDVKPVRAGVYETRDSDGGALWFNYFDGVHWHWGNWDVDGADRCREYPDAMSSHRVKCWRGVVGD